MREIDLHVHTTASDGSLSPARVVALAKEQGLQAIAITDHDNAEGYAEAARAGEELGVEVVPGIEISSRCRGPVHVLGYYCAPPALSSLMGFITRDREARNRKITELMAADGLPVCYEALQERFGTVIGRPHFGLLLMELGLVQSIDEAFDRYLEKGRKYYMPRSALPLEDSLSLIRQAGGLAVLAHPFQYRLEDSQLRELIRFGMEHGLAGIECRYSGYSPEQCAYLEALAEEYGLLKTGGSDFHGSNKPHIRLGSGKHGELSVPYEFLRRLKERHKE